MGKNNAISKSYLQDPERFAQIWNNHGFGGNNIIKPEKLRELDPEEQLFLSSSVKNRTHFLEKYRDILKIYDDSVMLLLLGIENQQEIHYAMPLRQMLYDAMRYDAQRIGLQKQHLQKQDLHGAEWLSKIAREDLFIPVLSLVIYWGNDPWDGPRSLYDMLEIPPALKPYQDLLNDYHMNLLEINAIENLNMYEGELRLLLGFVKYQNNKHALWNFLSENEQQFNQIGAETARAISVLAHVPELDLYINNAETKGDPIKMCKALQELMMDEREAGLAEGRNEGKAEGRKQAAISFILKMIRKGFSPEQAAELLELDPEYTKTIYEISEIFAPDYDEIKIYEAYISKKHEA